MKLFLWHRDRLCREAVRRALSGTPLAAQLCVIDDALALRKQSEGKRSCVLLVELALLGARAEAIASLKTQAAVIALCESATEAGAYEALGEGALGLLAPPRLQDDGELLGGARFVQRLERLLTVMVQEAEPARAPLTAGESVPLIALGASTGGPLALSRVLAALPSTLQGAVVVVQHMESDFNLGFAEWLGGHCSLPVRVPAVGEAPQAGTVYVAGPGGHLVLSPARQFALRPAQGVELHVPSVDALFLSLADHARPGVAALLTGMGSDGVEGLLRLRQRGWYTVAQDEATSVVFGMPRVAAERGAADQVLALEAIAPSLLRRLPPRREGG